MPTDKGKEMRKRKKRGKAYNKDYEASLKRKGYTIVKKTPINEGKNIRYDVEKNGEGSAIIRSNNPAPKGEGPKMRTVKKAPRYKKGRVTKRRHGRVID